jgi:single-strand DNA-binding protein
MLLTGRVESDNYTNKNGEKVYSVRVVVEDVEFAERKSSSDSYAGGGYAGASEGGSNPMPAPGPQGGDDDDDFVSIKNTATGSIPFFNNDNK